MDDEQETAEETIVYQVLAAPDASCWLAPGDELVGLADRKIFDDWLAPSLELTCDFADIPTFSWIDGVTCGFILKIDVDNNPAISSFSYQAGWVLDLAGDAKGFSMVVPQVGRAIDAANTANIENPQQTRWAFTEENVEESLFRSIPRLDAIFCGEYESSEEEPITDLDDYNNMAFRIWSQLTNSSGITFKEIWRAQR